MNVLEKIRWELAYLELQKDRRPTRCILPFKDYQEFCLLADKKCFKKLSCGKIEITYFDTSIESRAWCDQTKEICFLD